MSELSEKCYSAQWMKNLEYVLWNTILNGPKKYGQDIISKPDIDKLAELSKSCNCWILFDDVEEETAVDLVEWIKKYNDAVSLGPNIINS
ncbi:hypothetical protein ACTJIJ_07500 [Niabella sp. 22666]|uniref:hypothetical protein n=1 Tax=Niabella sp. 22666 TaxID=3453954 RepID=UPI003F8646F9